MSNDIREPQGIPTGGRFADHDRPESEVDLATGAAHTTVMDTTSRLITGLALKDMEPTLLLQALAIEAEQNDHDQTTLNRALGLASYLHRNHTRANRRDFPRTPYIEHPLRGALRLYRWGVTDPDMIVAEILHDTVEDNWLEFARDIVGFDFGSGGPDDESRARGAIYPWITRELGEGVMSIVKAMTNDIAVAGRSRETKHQEYREHVCAAIADPRVALCKLADFVDNALGLHHHLGGSGDAMVRGLAGKYLPLVPVFVRRIDRHDVLGLIDDDGHRRVLGQLAEGGQRLRELAA